MAPSGDVQVVPESGVEVEQLVVEAYDGGSGSATTTTAEEESVMTVLPEQHDTVPETVTEPDHHEDKAVPVQVAAEEPSASEKAGEEEEKPNEEQKPAAAKEEGEHNNKEPVEEDDHQESTRERLKRHRMEVAGRVWVPENWGQEKLLKEWVDCTVFDRPLVPAGLLSARRALVAESCTRRGPDRASTVSSSAGTNPLRVRNGCSS